MTDERKQELKRLLNEAMEDLQIGIPLGVGSLLLSSTTGGTSRATEAYFSGGSLPLPKVKLKNYLQQRWGSYGIDSSSGVMYLQFYMANQTTESKLLDFIRRELEPFIHEKDVDSSYSTSYAITEEKNEFRLHTIRGGVVHLPSLLKHLLKIAVTWGVEKAVSTFDEGSFYKGKQGFYQDIVSLEGIVIENTIEVCDVVRLVPFPQSTTFEFESYFRGFSFLDSPFARERNTGKTLLIIDRPLLSIFHKSSKESFDEMLVGDLPFQIETNDMKFPNHEKVDSSRNLFCRALSLACNSPVQIARQWWFLAEDDLFHPFPGGSMAYFRGGFGDSVKAGQPEIDKAKCLYHDLIKLKRETQEKLIIAIDRWIQSKTYQAPYDKIIDLAIAFEALYLPDPHESTFKFSTRASWYLGDDKKNREELFALFKKFYGFRSKVVHGGKPKDEENVTINSESIPISQFVTEVQDLCLKSIEKIMTQCLKDGKFPDNDYWDGLILGVTDAGKTGARG